MRTRPLAGVLVALLAVAGCSTSSRHDAAAAQLVAHVRPSPADTASAAAVARAEQAFTLALLRHVNASGGNVVLSPSSLAIALSMLQDGAGGATRAGIARVLQTSALTGEQQGAGWASILADQLRAHGVTLSSANALWLQRNLPMRQPFLDDLARYFRTGVWQVDFAGHLPAALRAINAWTARTTHGKITRLFGDGDVDASTALVLANAVYFKAAWQVPFDASLTRDGDFHAAGGRSERVPFMSTGGALSAASTPAYDAVQLPYAGGRFAALAIMPARQALPSFVDALTPAGLQRIVAALAPRPVALRLPRFAADQYTNLDGTLAAMGMGAAFGPGADLSPMSPVGLSVRSVVQRDYLRVNEQGSEAAAVTGIAVATSGIADPRTISFDHPFLLLIRDTTTGVVLFAVEVERPSV